MPRETTYSGNQPQGLEAAAAEPVEFADIAAASGNGTGITISDDGSVEIGQAPSEKQLDSDKFNQNLADVLDSGALGAIAEDILEGVAADISSRSSFIDNYNKGLDLLGLKIEEATSTRTQKRNVSRVGHPLLLEAVVKFQAQARGELMPAFGPCKAATVGGSTEAQDQLAADFESDMNYFLTQVDKGFYPDFDRGLFALGFGGNLFKKVYHDPLKRFPVSRTIQIEDFIVSEDACDIDDAQRLTHRFFMKDGTLKKMQHAGEYVDAPVGPGQQSTDPTKMKQGVIIGVIPQSNREKDLEHEIYETHTDLDLGEHGFREKGAPKDIPLPYIVTVDVATRTVLSLRRNWRKGDEQFTKRRRFVHYGLVPSFGFLCLGYLHLLGNQTRALRAIWRILIDAGMFSSFPGGIKSKDIRTSTNEMAPGPGEFVDIDIGPFDKIQDGLMLMPYKEPNQVFIALATQIGSDSQRMGGIPEIPVDEGRTHIPVGTMLSMIEQATQTMASVHKRMHAAMQEELTLIKECFSEDPGALTRLARNPARQWEVATEFGDIDLVPATDPNVPSQMHRIQQATAIIALAGGAPQLYDLQAVHRRALKATGVTDWQVLMQPGQQQAPQDPKAIAKMAELQLKQKQLDQKEQDSQRKAAHDALSAKTELMSNQQAAQQEAADLASKERIAAMKEDTARLRIHHDTENVRREFAGSFATEGLKQHHESQRNRESEHLAGTYGLAQAAAQHHAKMEQIAATPKPEPAAPAKKGKGRPKGSKNKSKGS